VASLYAKKINGGTYYYLREMARVDGRPKRVSERYLGTAEEIAAAMASREGAAMPQRSRHLAFGDVAAVWRILDCLDVVGIVDAVVGARRADAAASTGTYLALAALNRVVAPCSKAAFADWWATTAADRFVRVPAAALDHRRFWDAMRNVPLRALTEIERRITVRMIEEFDLDVSALALDMTNFATYIDTANGKAPIAQRGKAKQKRADLRLVGLGLVVTRDGGIPLLSHAYPGNRPDVTQFTTMIDELCARHAALATGGAAGDMVPGEITVVFDAGQNSLANFAHLDASRLHFVGSIPPSDCTDLLKRPARARRSVDEQRFGGLTALETRRTVHGQDRRVVLTHSPTLHTAQSRGFDQTLAKAGARLGDLAAALARGKTRRAREKVEAEIRAITKDPWVARVTTTELTGDAPKDLRLAWHIDAKARRALENEVFGKRVLVTDHDDWTIADIVTGYRSQSDAEFSFRQLKDPHVVSFGPMHHWTDHNIRIHVFTCVLALSVAHLMRRQADRAGEPMSVRELLGHLAGIQETVLIYPSTGGRPKARRMLTDVTTVQARLADIFHLELSVPRT
jgi:transposase